MKFHLCIRRQPFWLIFICSFSAARFIHIFVRVAVYIIVFFPIRIVWATYRSKEENKIFTSNEKWKAGKQVHMAFMCMRPLLLLLSLIKHLPLLNGYVYAQCDFAGCTQAQTVIENFRGCFPPKLSIFPCLSIFSFPYSTKSVSIVCGR